MSFISLAKRFKQKSNLLRFNFSLDTNFEFHYHGIKSLLFLKFHKVFCNYFLSIIRNLWVELSIKGTSFLRSVIGVFKNTNHSFFNFSSNTYSHALVFSANESVHVKVTVPGFYCNNISALKLIFQIPRRSFH